MDKSIAVSQQAIVGPYKLIRCLGVGGMGEVFLAWDERLKRHVAIKRLRPDVQMTSARKRRFRREARAAARLSHPAIVQVHDFLTDPDGDAIVMEYVEGSTLAQLLADEPIDVSTALRFAKRIAEGLAKAHDLGFIHRDLKAENVMVTPESEIKILDFGLAKPLNRSETDSSLTHDGAILGTVRAMSPEQASGFDVDARADLYSLGVLLYEMLIGISPFRGDNAQKIHRKVLTEKPPPPRALRPALPEELSLLVESLLEKDPNSRPADARQVIAALQPLVASPEVEKLGPPPVARGQHVPSEASTQSDLNEARPFPRPKPTTGQSSYASQKTRLGPILAFLILVVASFVAGRFLDDIGRSGESAEAVQLPPTSFEGFRKGLEYLKRTDRQGYIDKAIETLTQTVALDPTYAPAVSALGRAYRRKWRVSPDPVWLNLASENALHAVELDPQLSYARVTLALVQIESGDLEQARLLLEDVKHLDPENVDVYRAFYYLAVKSGDEVEAIRQLKEAIRYDSDDWYLYSALGHRLQLSGEYEAAEEQLKKSLELAPDNAYTLLSLGAIYYFQDRFDEAVAAFQRSIEIQPSAKAYMNLGTLKFFRGMIRESAAAYEQAIELGANDAVAWGNLADAYRMIPGKESDADHAFLQAIDLLSEKLILQPNEMGSRSRLALYEARRGDKEQALANLVKLEPLAERNAHASYRAALVFELCAHRDRALEALELALSKGYPLSETLQEPDLVRLREDVRYRRLVLRFKK